MPLVVLMDLGVLKKLAVRSFFLAGEGGCLL